MQREKIALARETGDDSLLAELSLASVSLNRISLLLRAERWRTALKETDFLSEVLKELGKNHQNQVGQMIESMTAELRLRFALGRGLALSHLKGKGKGRKAAIAMLQKGLRHAREAEATGCKQC